MYIALRDAMVRGDLFSSPLDGARQLGVEALELELTPDFCVSTLADGDLVDLGTDGDVEAYRARLYDLGLHACALLTARDLSAGERDANVDWLVRAVEIASLMGAGVVRVDPMMKRERELDFGTRVGLFVDALGEVLERTAGLPVNLGIENHGFQGNNLAFLLSIYQQVGSPRLGSTIDTGNFYWRGYPLSEVYGILGILAPYARHTHLKNINYPGHRREAEREAGWEYTAYAAPLPDGDIDHARVLRMLRDAGYTGALCIEDESLGRFTPGERLAALQRDVAHVRGLLEAL